MSQNPQNLLSQSTSPYLLQHASNPVNWRAWSPEALKEAAQLNKPILLSIGYSACHWCHVMAHESFENQQTAEIMNELFINIKVDREERPDLDKVYQHAHHLLTQRSGGWPLTVFLMPDEQTPFFAGTYFPDQPRHGLPDFQTLLKNISSYFCEHQTELAQQNKSLLKAMASLRPKLNQQNTDLTEHALDTARQELEKNTDKLNGGFGKAPKFPHPHSVERLLRHWAHTERRDEAALKTACLTLDAMANGGINDQIGGGFCRYSVDDYWMIPHFEKMLYDNGPLLSLYSQAWLATGKPLYRRTATTIAEWVLKEMQSPEGGYYSSLDADSENEAGEHKEGSFYIWKQDEIRKILDPTEYLIFSKRFGVDQKANFEGNWYPYCHESVENIALQTDNTGAAVETILSAAITKLDSAREQRIRPGRDDKILVSWNALMIKGMSIAGRLLDRPHYIESAEKAFDFIRSTLCIEGRLLASYKDNKAHLNAYLDDYVFLIDAGLELLQAHWRQGILEWIIDLADVVLDQFYDPAEGGFFFTSNDHERLIERQKPLADEAIPSGNGIAAYSLARLGHLTGESRFLEASRKTLRLAQESYSAYASAYNSLLLALEEYHYGNEIIIIHGDPNATAPWTKAANQKYSPRRMIFSIPKTNPKLPGLLALQPSPDNGVMATICTGSECKPAIDELEKFRREL